MSKTKSSIERVFAHFLHGFWQPDVLGECSPHLEVTLNTAMSSHLYDSKLQEDQDISVLVSFPQVVVAVWGFLFLTLINGLTSEVFSTFILAKIPFLPAEMVVALYNVEMLLDWKLTSANDA